MQVSLVKAACEHQMRSQRVANTCELQNSKAAAQQRYRALHEQLAEELEAVNVQVRSSPLQTVTLLVNVTSSSMQPSWDPGRFNTGGVMSIQAAY